MSEPRIGKIEGLSDADLATVNDLLDRLAAKRPRNLVRAQYYDGKRALKQMSKVVPPHYNQLGIVLGWNAKAVDLLARRCNLDGFAWPDGDLDSLGYPEVWEDNQLGAATDEGTISALIHSTAFVVTSVGVGDEPDALVQFAPALNATGEWNPRTRRLDSFLWVTRREKRDDKGDAIVEFVLYLPGVTILCAKNAKGAWAVTDRQDHDYGMPAEPLPYHPRLLRPFGSSRISRATMGLQDAAVRTLVRLEGHMDVYAYPEFWMLGADSSIFGDQTRWQVMLGRIKGIPDDETLTNPRADVKQFTASSPEPHLADLNALAKLFCRESALPDSSLAITDLANPTSADAYDASQYDLIAEAEGATDEWTPALQRAMVRALAMKNTEPNVPDAWRTIAPQWRDPRFLSRAAEADAGMKQLTAVPWLAETEVGLDLLGLTPQQKAQALGERRRARSQEMLTTLAQAAPVETALDVADSEADDIKAKADAMGILIRSGVDPQSAAARVGLDGLTFTGAVPVSLRQPEQDAAELEER